MREILITIICLILITTLAFTKRHALKPGTEISVSTISYFREAVITSDTSKIIAPNTFSNIKVFAQIN